MATSVTTGATTLDDSAVQALAATMRGPLIKRGDPGYDEARTIYNAMIDKRPALIAQCATVADVIAAVNFARDNGVIVAIRGGGHNGPGLGLVDDGLVIDLSRMNGVRVDPEARTARVEGGALLGDLHHATNAFGLATPSGIISTTGVGGITLGGGLGHLTRQFGLAIDNLLEADVVLADGSFVTASETENPDLFWALRGGLSSCSIPSLTSPLDRCSGHWSVRRRCCAGTGSSSPMPRTISTASSPS
jgi:FAD/FMN-containing dehydrogenase